MQNGFGTKDFQAFGREKIGGTKYQTAVKKLEIFILEMISQKLIDDLPVKTKGAENYANAVRIMENNIDKNLSVSDIADMCKMSEIGLKKTFAKYSGMGVMAYFNRMKIAEATDMIKSGMSVRETALTLGFINQNYFSTVFKRIDGKAPSSYRK
jgi:transcriptional regulator GlxA family with amidase domain